MCRNIRYVLEFIHCKHISEKGENNITFEGREVPKTQQIITCFFRQKFSFYPLYETAFSL